MSVDYCEREEVRNWGKGTEENKQKVTESENTENTEQTLVG